MNRLAAIAFGMISVSTSLNAAVITVYSTADGGGTCPGASCTLRQALASATSGSRIRFSLPPNSEISLTSGELVVDKSLGIEGPGAHLLTIKRSANAPEFRIFRVGTANSSQIFVTMSGITIANGRVSTPDSGGGGILSNASLTLVDSVVSGNYSVADGGGIATTGGVSGFQFAGVSLKNSTLARNVTLGKGGGILSVVSKYCRQPAAPSPRTRRLREVPFPLQCTTCSRDA